MKRLTIVVVTDLFLVLTLRVDNDFRNHLRKDEFK